MKRRFLLVVLCEWTTVFLTVFTVRTKIKENLMSGTSYSAVSGIRVVPCHYSTGRYFVECQKHSVKYYFCALNYNLWDSQAPAEPLCCKECACRMANKVVHSVWQAKHLKSLPVGVDSAVIFPPPFRSKTVSFLHVPIIPQQPEVLAASQSKP